MVAAPQARFIGPPERPCAAFLSVPEDGVGTTGALIAPPLGYEYWTAHGTLRVIAERLARAGILALRLDYDGTGDSAGEHLDGGRVSAWCSSLLAGAEELRRLGCSRLIGVGLRLGATLLVEQGAELGLDQLVCWAPIESGRRYVRELRMVATPFPDDDPDGPLAGAISLQGVGLRDSDLADLAALDATRVGATPATSVLLLDRADRPPNRKLRARLDELGAKVFHDQVDGTASVLDVATEAVTVPEEIVDRIAEFISAEPGGGAALAAGRDEASFAWRGGVVTERFVSVAGLAGVRTSAPGRTPRGLVVFLDSGSEHRVGPGRAWVELARTLACAGYDALRVDFSGWGESPQRGHFPGRPYDGHLLAEARAVVAAQRSAGDEHIVLAGLCSGAWVALSVAPDTDLAGVVAFNPWMNHHAGEQLFETPAEAARVLAPARARHARLRPLGIFHVLEALGLHNTGGRLLVRLRRARVPVLYLFAEGDLSIEWLEQRVPLSWRRARSLPGVEAETLAGLDHPMFRLWCRPAVYARIIAYLDRILGEGSTP